MIQFNPDIHKRSSLRLKNYDYSQNGLYFITIAVQNKLCLFGKIINQELVLNESGKMIAQEWENLEKKYSNIILHNFIVMPNHFHGIIEIKNENEKTMENENVGANLVFAQNVNTHMRVNTRFTPTGGKFNYNKNNISAIIQAFKSLTTTNYIQNVTTNNWMPFNKKLWQKNYYEHIIRDETSYYTITQYISKNPLKWDEDTFYYTEIF